MTRLFAVLILTIVFAVPARGADEKPAAASAPAKPATQQERDKIAAMLAIAEKRQATEDEIAQLTADLKDASPRVRAHAAHVLGSLGAAGRPAVEALVSLAADPEPVVRREAVQALLEIRPGPKVTIPLIKKLLADADPAVRMRILNTLANVGKPAVPGLIEALKDEEAGKFACLVISEIGPDAAECGPALVERLKAEKLPEVRHQLMMALGAIESEVGVPVLVEEFADPESTNKVVAAFALGRIGPAAKAGVKVLSESLADKKDPVLKAVSAWALVRILPEDAAVKDKSVEVLAESLMSENALARTAAMRALADIRPGPDKVMPAIQRHLAGQDAAAAEESLHLLAAMGPPAVPALIKTLERPEFRALTASILGYIGPAAKDAVPALVEIAKTDKNHEARREALLALGGIGGSPELIVPVAVAALADRDSKLVVAACFTLAKLGPAAKDAVPALTKLAQGKDEVLKEQAEKALKAIEGK